MSREDAIKVANDDLADIMSGEPFGEITNEPILQVVAALRPSLEQTADHLT